MSMKPRIIGLDIGDSRIGVAISDPLGITAAGLEAIERKSMREDVRAVAEMARRHGAVEIVIGLPKNTDGSVGDQSLKIQSFARKLTRVTGLPVIYEDERLTTISAIRTLTLQGVTTSESKDIVDLQSAAIILQKFLDRREPPPSA